MSDSKTSPLSEREQRLAEEVGRYAGHHAVDRVFDMLLDEEVIHKVTSKWGGEAQRIVGAAVLRFVFWVVGVMLLIAAWKTGALGWLGDLLEGRKP